MSLRCISPEVFHAMLRFYGIAVASGLIFAALILAFGSSPSRGINAALAATLWVTIGALYVGNMVGSMLQTGGVSLWRISIALAALVVSPGILLFMSPIWGPVVFTLGFPLILLLFVQQPND